MSNAKAYPAKAFFVSMLTRDIDLSDAILDLLDNCVDGILRSNGVNTESNPRPYEGFYAKISISDEAFSIFDNCGGIPLHIAQEYAFRMGRPQVNSDNLPTVGLYGIGMKRAIFKMGQASTVYSYNGDDKFEVNIESDWLKNDSEWELPIIMKEDIPLTEQGTCIRVTSLYEGIKEEFSSETYINNLIKLISNHYSFIINKGFKVYVNDLEVQPHNILFIYSNDHDEKRISPYIYQAEIDGVKIDLKVGIYRETPTEEDLDNEQVVKRTSEDSGWTIICNDRVVLFNDKTIITGWGEANVPSFHNQFIGITGVVHFMSTDVSKLPLTTTKRGIDASSKLYLYVKKYMREGTKIFTNYTNQIKKEIKTEKKFLDQSRKIAFDEFNKENIIPKAEFKAIRNTTENEINAVKYKPNLPTPSVSSRLKAIHFYRNEDEVNLVSRFLFDDVDRTASEIGNECFNYVLKLAKSEE